jgi:hypothetical protein
MAYQAVSCITIACAVVSTLRFLHGSEDTRNKMLKLIPHIADGSWLIKQSVGTTPVLIGKALRTTYHITPQYIEVDIDVSANNVASYVTGLVRGATKSLVIDMGELRF